MDLTRLARNFRLHPRNNGSQERILSRKATHFVLCDRMMTPAISMESGGWLVTSGGRKLEEIRMVKLGYWLWIWKKWTSSRDLKGYQLDFLTLEKEVGVEVFCAL